MLVLLLVGAIVSISSGHAHVGNWTTNDNGFVTQHSGLSVSLTGEPILLWVAISLLYHFVAGLMTAQTVGKRMMGLKLITVNGRPLGLEPVLLRTLGRIVDVLPVFYLIGWIAMRGATSRRSDSATASPARRSGPVSQP